MPFQVLGSLCEKCDGLTWTDTVGQYDIATRPFGYGGPESPAAYDDVTSYVLDIWKPGSDINGASDYTLDLLTNTPTIDSDGNPVWTISASDLGEEEPMTSGVWYGRVTMVWDGDTYYGDCMSLFTADIQSQIDSKLRTAPVPITIEMAMLQAELESAKANACCGYATRAQESVDWLLANIQNCC